jgi:hypothetical protein
MQNLLPEQTDLIALTPGASGSDTDSTYRARRQVHMNDMRPSLVTIKTVRAEHRPATKPARSSSHLPPSEHGDYGP